MKLKKMEKCGRFQYSEECVLLMFSFLCMYLGIRKKTTITASTAIDYGGCSHATKATRGAVSLTSEL